MLSSETWCLTSTETMRLIRDGSSENSVFAIHCQLCTGEEYRPVVVHSFHPVTHTHTHACGPRQPFQTSCTQEKGRHFSAQSFILRRGEGRTCYTVYAERQVGGGRSHLMVSQNRARPFAAEAVRTLVEFMYLVFTRMLGDSYRRRLGSLLLRYVF